MKKVQKKAKRAVAKKNRRIDRIRALKNLGLGVLYVAISIGSFAAGVYAWELLK